MAEGDLNSVSLKQHIDTLVQLNDKRFDSFENRISEVRALATDTAKTTSALHAEVLAFKDDVAGSFLSLKEAVATAMQSADKATGKAETANEKRFDSVNEFRATLADQQRMLMPRAEAEARMASQAEKITKLEAEIAENRASHGGLMSGWGLAVGVVVFVLVILQLVNIASSFLSKGAPVTPP